MSSFLLYTEKVTFPPAESQMTFKKMGNNSNNSTVRSFSASSLTVDSSGNVGVDNSDSDDDERGLKDNDRTKNGIPSPIDADPVVPTHPNQIPIWNALNSTNHFINWPHWTGDVEDIILIHFLEGKVFENYADRRTWEEQSDYKTHN